MLMRNQQLLMQIRQLLCRWLELGADVKQPDGSYRFHAYANAVLFFTLLHILVENVMAPTNLIAQRGIILMVFGPTI